MDFDRIAAELVRTLRGACPQSETSRRLGYRTNVVYTWESGRRAPATSDFFLLAERSHIDVTAVLLTLYGSPPSWLRQCRMTRPSDVTRLVADLTGQVTPNHLAAQIGASRATVVRWREGRSEPRLPDLLRIVDAMTGRVLDFVAGFADPSTLESTRDARRVLEARRALAVQHPFAQAVRCSLELHAYRKLDAHRPGLIARRLGITEEEETAALGALADAELVRMDKGRYVVVEQADEEPGDRQWKTASAELARIAVERVTARPDRIARLGGHQLVAISRKTHERLRELEEKHQAEVRRLISQSRRAECVVLFAHALVRLDE